MIGYNLGGSSMHGKVSFVELGTSNAERSRPFFERVFGWNFHPMAEGGGWFQAPSMRVGLHGDDPQPQIYVYFEVPDLEQAMALVREAGGEAEPPEPETPGFGRFSNCRDPQGIRFGLHQHTAA
jgi:predicted enzyme related to lactoylglutathione lyase